MFLLTKDDKKVWQDYITNVSNFILDTKSSSVRKNSFSKKRKETKSFSKLIKTGKIRFDAIIDLHGYRLNNAKAAFFHFILKSYTSNYNNVLVVTGKGFNNMGVLKKELPRWLNDKEINKYVISYSYAPRNLGGEGAFLIRIRNKSILTNIKV